MRYNNAENAHSEILQLNDLRLTWLQREEHEPDFNKEVSDQIDKLAYKIVSLLQKNQLDLQFEFILEMLSHQGDCPDVLYDDNGHWAIGGTSAQSVNFKVDDWRGIYFVEKEQWFDTPREALKYHLENHYILENKTKEKND